MYFASLSKYIWWIQILYHRWWNVEKWRKSSFLYPPPNEVGGGYTGFTVSVRLSVRLSVCPSVRRQQYLRNRYMELSDWYTIWKASVQWLCRIIIFSLQLLRSLLCAKMCAILAKSDTFARVDTHFSKMAAWIFKLCASNERPWSRDCAEEFFYTPRPTKLEGGILDSLCPSVRLSVCPSVRLSVDSRFSETASWN